MAFSRTALALALLALSGVALVAAQNEWSDWKTGRATFYGKDGWSIHYGSCGYNYLDENAGTGWDVAAISDVAWDYRGSCGRCKEVKCKNMWFKDGYGQQLDRSGVCFDPDASVVVTITDTCPCHYPNNYYSNKRWCCGDMYHLDISLWAYEKLADTKWGVIGVEWRDVPCWHKPTKPAKNPWGQRSGPDRGPPGNWNPSMDGRPYKAIDYGRKWEGRKLRGAGSV